MHIADFSVGMMGANGVVGGGYNLAVGAALASKLQGNGRIAVCFFGDGASNRGTFHEGLNMAAAWKLPVLFVCENNEWASTTPYHQATSVHNVVARAAGYGIPGRSVNGNDLFAVLNVMEEAAEWVRNGEGPMLLECKTYRIGGHFVGDPEMYRSREVVRERFEKDDPIKHFETCVIKEKWLKQTELDQIGSEVQQEINMAVDQAKQDPYPAEDALWDDVYAAAEVFE